MQDPVSLDLDVILFLDEPRPDAMGKHRPVRAEKPELMDLEAIGL